MKTYIKTQGLTSDLNLKPDLCKKDKSQFLTNFKKYLKLIMMSQTKIFKQQKYSFLWPKKLSIGMCLHLFKHFERNNRFWNFWPVDKTSEVKPLRRSEHCNKKIQLREFTSTVSLQFINLELWKLFLPMALEIANWPLTRHDEPQNSTTPFKSLIRCLSS